MAPAVSATSVAAAVPPALACRNCHAPLGHPQPNFCGQCGQETSLKPPTVMEFIHQFGGNYMAMEGALWRTLLLLLFLPGRLTREYLNGRKKRYVLPLRLYITISLLTLLALRFGAAPHMDFGDGSVLKLDSAEEANANLIALGDVKAGVKDGKVVCDGLPKSWCTHLEERFSLDPKSAQREMRKVPERFISHWGTAMFALLPLYALFLKLVYIDRRMRWSEHLVFALHLHAFWFAMLATAVSGIDWLKATAAIAVPLYSLVALKTVYGGRWWSLLLRGALLCSLYGTTLICALAIVAIWAFLA